MIIGNQVDFQEEKHRYFLKTTGKEMESVSSFFEQFEPYTDWDTIKYYVARKRLFASGNHGANIKTIPKDVILLEKEIVTQEWAATAKFSTDHGNYIHKVLEDYNNGLEVPESMLELCKYVFNMMKGYYRIHSEEKCFSETNMLCGTADIVAQRQKNIQTSLLDFGDYKTNIENGIQYDSIYRKNNRKEHYNKFFKQPLEHLEYCNYTLYALKISMYAYMFHLMGYRIGKLFIIYINANIKKDTNFVEINNVQYVPIPFMKEECKALLENRYLSKWVEQNDW